MDASVKDFDRFLREREGRGMRIRVLGRELEAPSELPWWYVMKVERLLKTGAPISGEENAALLRQLLKQHRKQQTKLRHLLRAFRVWQTK